MKKSFEAMLAFYCAPTLAGIKPASLFTFKFNRNPLLKKRDCREIASAAKKLFHYGVRTQFLCECETSALIFVFRPDVLAASMTGEVLDFLAEYGYERGSSLDEKIWRLRQRLRARACGDFPHEIGVFLGYPLEDVRGFIHDGGRNSKAHGVWHVYGDCAAAMRLFESYRCCTERFCATLESGGDVYALLREPPRSYSLSA